MATVEECEAALRELAARLAGVDSDTRDRYVLERTLSCQLTDLDDGFHGRLGDEGLVDVGRGVDPAAQVRLRVRSDDLVKLLNGDLAFPLAWATGRLRIDASLSDLLRLRSLL